MKIPIKKETNKIKDLSTFIFSFHTDGEDSGEKLFSIKSQNPISHGETFF